MQPRDWIKAKGQKALAVVLGERPATIRGWSSRNVIPRDKWPEVLTKYPEVGLNDLLAMEKASRAAVQK